MKDFYLFKILHSIKYNYSTAELIGNELQYSQIAMLISEAFENKFLEYNENEIIKITSMGEEEYKNLSLQIKSINKNDWIVPFDKYRIEKISITDIYVPSKRFTPV